MYKKNKLDRMLQNCKKQYYLPLKSKRELPWWGFVLSQHFLFFPAMIFIFIDSLDYLIPFSIISQKCFPQRDTMCSNSIFNKIVKSHTVVTIPCRVLWSNEDNATSTCKMYYYRMFTSFPSHATSNHHVGKKPEDVTTLMCYRMCHICCCVPCSPAHNVIVKTHATLSYILLLTCHLLLPDPPLL